MIFPVILRRIIRFCIFAHWKQDTMTITEEELQRIVARAVEIALKEIKDREQTSKIQVKQFTEEELEEAMCFMAANRDKQNDWNTAIPNTKKSRPNERDFLISKRL